MDEIVKSLQDAVEASTPDDQAARRFVAGAQSKAIRSRGIP
jgi:hypothetical protein